MIKPLIEISVSGRRVASLELVGHDAFFCPSDLSLFFGPDNVIPTRLSAEIFVFCYKNYVA